MADPVLHVEREGDHVAVVVIDRPPVNALSAPHWVELGDVIAGLDEDPSVRAVVLTGASASFCAGADVRDLEPGGTGPAMLTVVAEACRAVREMTHPVIAAVDGAAHGGGLELMLACDIRVAGSRATFSASSVNMGLIASVSSLIDTVGGARARRMLLTGEPLGAEAAHEWGLVTDLSGTPRARAVELAQLIASKPPLSVAAIKAAFRAPVPGVERDRLVTDAYERLVTTADHAEAVRAFLEKRPGDYEGK